MKAKIIIAGGGTGGHIYPGVAIARAIQRLSSDIEIHFVGAHGGLEENIIPREKFALHLVSVGRLHKSVSLVTRLTTLLKMPIALIQCLIILTKLRPISVLGVGGFASGPMLLVASLLNYRTYIWEPNAMPGMANRWLAGFVTETLLVFEEARKFLKAKKIRLVGIPVRFSLAARKSQDAKLRLLIFGGSQGARAINEIVFQFIESKADKYKDLLEIVHQTGPLDFARAQKIYSAAPAHFQCFEYLHDMKDRFAWCDLVIARSGASTVAEIIACRKAAVFIPLPTAADDHQRKNAEVLVKKNAAEMILQSDFNLERLTNTIESFIQNRDKIAKFSESVQSFEFAKSDEEIAKILLGDLLK